MTRARIDGRGRGSPCVGHRAYHTGIVTRIGFTGNKSTASGKREKICVIQKVAVEDEVATQPDGPKGFVKANQNSKDFVYDPDKGKGIFQIGGGSLFFIAALYGFARLFARRADYFTKVRLAARNEDDDLLSKAYRNPIEIDGESDQEILKEKGPLDVFSNALTVAGISVILYIVSSKTDNFMSSYPLPDQYTVRQVAITLKTIVTGIAYLATFVYGANALGLFLLGIDMLRNPEKHSTKIDAEK